MHQIGVRVWSKEGDEFAHANKKRLKQWPARGIVSNSSQWQRCLQSIARIKRPVHLSIDIDGLDGSLVPATGTPVPGGLGYWQVVDLIETTFRHCYVVSVDVCEVAPQSDSPFNRICNCHVGQANYM
jgi:agmatinase